MAVKPLQKSTAHGVDCIPTWQYNGIADWGVIMRWCEDNLRMDDWYTNDRETIWFLDDPAHTLFLLRWS